MLRNVWGVVSGVVVLALGVIAVMGLLRPGQAPVEVAPIDLPAPVPVPTVDGRAVAAAAPVLPGVSARITRVLEWDGAAGFAGDDEIAQLPPKVAAVLTHYGVPLRVPLTGDAG